MVNFFNDLLGIVTGGTTSTKATNKTITDKEEIEIVNEITNTINVNIDNVVKKLVSNIEKQVDLLKSSQDKTIAILTSQINNVVKQIETSQTILKQTLVKALDNNVDIIAKNNETLVSKLIAPVLKNVEKLAEQEIAIEKQQILSFEKMFTKLIETQLKQSKDISSKLDEIINTLTESLENIDYVNEANLADWIKQALQPLQIELSPNFTTMDLNGNPNIFSWLSPIRDLFLGLVNRLTQIRSIFTKLENGQYSDIDQMKTEFFGQGLTGEFAEGVFFMLTIIPLMKEFGQALFAKMFTELNFLAIREAMPARPNEKDAFTLLHRGEYGNNEYLDNMRDLGYSPELIDKMRKISFSIPNMGDLHELLRRKEITSEQFKNEIINQGFTAYWAQEFEKLAYYQAPPQDIIRFMVRDVFNEQLVQEGRLAEGGDNPKYLELAEKVGVSRELALLYWMSHWILPSYNQGYEMFQREKINREQLEQLFIAGDLAPAWREKMLSIAFSLPTRVDVRRAYEDDIIDDEKLMEFIRHSGVEPEWRDAIFNWHKARKVRIQTGSNKAKQLSVSQIMRVYRGGQQDLQWAINELKKIGYSEQDALIVVNSYIQGINESEDAKYADKLRNEIRQTAINGYRSRTLSRSKSKTLLTDTLLSNELAEQVLNLTDTQYHIDRKQEIIEVTRKLYLGHEISENQLASMLRNEGFTNEETQAHLNDLRPLREIRYKELTRADIAKGVKSGDFNIEWGIQQLKGLGYSDTTISEIIKIENWSVN